MNVCPYTNTLAATGPNCRACPYNDSLWVQDMSCSAELILSVDAINLTTSTRATSQATHADDRLQYNLHTTNTSSSPKTIPIEMSVDDLVEYGSVIDPGGGTLDQETKKVSWGVITIRPGQTDTRSFVLQLDDKLPTTPQAVDNTKAYDCKLTTMYGNYLSVSVDCPPTKVVEGIIKQLPKADVATNIAFSISLLAIVVYFYVRARQLNREIRIVRKDFNVGLM